MPILPNPYFVILDAERRRAEFLSEADRDRLVALAKPDAGRRQQRIELAAIAAVVVALALFAAGPPPFSGASGKDQQRLLQTVSRGAAQEAEGLAQTSALQIAREPSK
jgi:hypothetical protein